MESVGQQVVLEYPSLAEAEAAGAIMLQRANLNLVEGTVAELEIQVVEKTDDSGNKKTVYRPKVIIMPRP